MPWVLGYKNTKISNFTLFTRYHISQDIVHLSDPSLVSCRECQMLHHVWSARPCFVCCCHTDPQISTDLVWCPSLHIFQPLWRHERPREALSGLEMWHNWSSLFAHRNTRREFLSGLEIKPLIRLHGNSGVILLYKNVNLSVFYFSFEFPRDEGLITMQWCTGAK